MHVTLIYLSIPLQLGLFSKGLRAVEPTISLEFDQTLSITQCDEGVQTGDKMVFKAVLNPANTNRLDWPLDSIMLGFIDYYEVYYNSAWGYEKLCEINVEDDGCKGFQPAKCGYCDTTANGIYNIIFNITVPERNSYTPKITYYESMDFLCSWTGKKATVRDGTSVVLKRMENIPVFFSAFDSIYMYVSPNGDVQKQTSRHQEAICASSLTGGLPVILDYSVGKSVYSLRFNKSWDCFLFDHNSIGDFINQHQDEQILFHYSGNCNKRGELQCFGRDILMQRLFCSDPVFTNFTDAGRKRVRVTWTCLAPGEYSYNRVSCRIGSNSSDFYRLPSVEGKITKQINQNPPIYQHTCEQWINLSEIDSSNLGPSYGLATMTQMKAVTPLCSRYSLSNYLDAFEPKVTLEFDPSLSVMQCGVVVEPGNTMVFKAVLDGSNVSSTDWPLNKIVLRQTFSWNDGFQDLCEINIEQDGCKGFQASLCGYCNATDGGVYHIVFNITAPYAEKIRRISDWVDEHFQCLWIGKKATVLGTSSGIKIDSAGNITWKAYIGETQVMHLSSKKDVVRQNSEYGVVMFDIYSRKIPGYLKISLRGLFNASWSFDFVTQYQSRIDDNFISMLQHTDEKVLFHQQDNCSGTIEYECFGQDFLKQKLFCKDLIFTNFTDNGNSRVRVTWTCMNSDPVLITCQLGWSRDNTTRIRQVIASSYEYHREKIYQDPPMYYYTCEIEVNSSEIRNNPKESLYHLATASSQSYTSQMCNGFSDSLLHYLPVPKISSDCPVGKWVKNGYIRKGTAATCLCEIVNLYDGGKVQWFDSKGVEVSFAGSTANLTIDTKDDQAYICRGFSDSGLLRNEVKYIPRLTYGPAVLNFAINETSSLFVQQGSDVTFSCDVESIFPAIAVLVGPGRGQIQEFRSQNQSLEFHLSNLTCEDSGRYECRGDDGVEFKTTDFDQFVDVNVNCDIKLKDPPAETSILKYSFQPQDSVVITLEVYGYPEPTEYGLKVQQDSGTSDVSKDMYSVTYTKLKPPFGLVTVEIFDKEAKKSTTYMLNIKNGVGEGVDITFVVNKEPDTESESSLPWLEIGIGIGGFILIIAILIIIICLVKRKRAHNKARNRQAERDGYNTLDFSLSDPDKPTQQPKPAAQSTSDERQKNQTSGGLRSHGPLPDIPDNDSQVNSTDYVDPEDAPDYVDHVDSADYVVPEDPPDHVVPEDSTDYVDHVDSLDYLVPEDSKDYGAPVDSTDYVVSEGLKDYVDPVDSTDYVASEDLTDYVDPVNSTYFVNVVDSTDDIDPEANDNNGYSSFI